jgi:hypothetical protein
MEVQDGFSEDLGTFCPVLGFFPKLFLILSAVILAPTDLLYSQSLVGATVAKLLSAKHVLHSRSGGNLPLLAVLPLSDMRFTTPSPSLYSLTYVSANLLRGLVNQCQLRLSFD